MAHRAVLPNVQDRPESQADLSPEKDAIKAHLTLMFTSLAVSRIMQEASEASLKKIITSLRPLREFTGRVSG